MAIERRVKVIEREDGTARVYIIERDDGLYRFEGEAQTDDQDGHGCYWAPCDRSGLYWSREAAEAAAVCDVLWLRDQTRSRDPR